MEKVSRRYTLEWRHQLSDKTYYTANYSDFTQEMTMRVRNRDTDGDGYPDWVEQRYWADFYDSTQVPYMEDESGGNVPREYVVSGTDTIWHYGDTPQDRSGEGIKIPWWMNDILGRETADWLTPEQYNQPCIMYPFIDEDMIVKYQNSPNLWNYYGEFYYSGADRYYHYTRSRTKELRIDLTSQVGRHNQIKTGLDYKTHDIVFDEMQLPGLRRRIRRTTTVFRTNSPAIFRTRWNILDGHQRRPAFRRLIPTISCRADPRMPDSTLHPVGWEFLWSPRLGFSHVITEKSTFTFGYGIYYQNPTYRDIYNNIDKRDELDEFFNTPMPLVGNPSVSAQKVTSYEFGLTPK
ncbi:MAG: hypothetical protein U5N26_01870 [Candidatus Marinimicrobia bacterium]|nr:hypothetical protein [Candidatus Neomarinimicrobiota bacterium]